MLQERGPSHPGLQSTAALAKPIFHFLPFLFGRARLPPPRARLSYSLASPGRWPLSSFSLRPLGHAGPAAAGRPEPAARSLHAPVFLFASVARSCVPKAGFPRGLTRWGEERFLAARLSGALRPGSFPAPAASPSLPGPEQGLAEAAREGARVRRHAPARPRPDRRSRLSSHGRTPRLCPEDQ